MSGKNTIFKKDIIGWSLYDFANTIYSMNIVSLYLKRYIIEDLGKDDRYFDIPFSISMLLAAVLLPALGAMSDHSSKKKIFLFLFTISCCIAVGLMAFIPASLFFVFMILFIISNFSYEAGQPFYNALLYSVADGKQARYISGVGVAFGYVGSILGMIIVLPFVTGSVFSVDIPFITAGGKAASFVPTALLFLLFSLPLLMWVKEKPVFIKNKVGFLQSYKDVWEGLSETKKYPGVLRFLIADYFFEDAVMTVILNIGIYCSIVIGLSETEITRFLIISTVSAVFGSFLLGKIAQYVSLKKTVRIIIYGWILSLILFIINNTTAGIWILGSVIGILLGGLWTTTRPLLAELVPREELGRFFGLFSLSGRAAAIIGPLLWTTAVYYMNADRYLGGKVAALLDIKIEDFDKLPYKTGVISLIIMLMIGLWIFRKVPEIRKVSDGR